MNSVASKMLVFLSVVAFAVAGYVFWIANGVSERLQTVHSQTRIYGVSEPNYSAFTHDFNDKAKFGEFNSKINGLLPKTSVNNVNFVELGKYKKMVYNKAVYDIEANDGYLQFVKFMGYINESRIVHRINDLSIKSGDDGKLSVRVNFEVLGYVKEAS